MKVSELIEELSKLSQDMPVMVRGYEDGVNDISGTKEIRVVRDATDRWYYGQHQPAEPGKYISGFLNRRVTEDDLELAYELFGKNEMAEL